MAKFEEHCMDCEKLLGDKCEDVNRWMDELYAKYKANHRRHRHCWRGVREARAKFGERGWKAAIVHIVRDCGAVPDQRDYDQVNDMGIIIAPEYLMYDGANESAFQKFKSAVEADWQKATTKLGEEIEVVDSRRFTQFLK